MEKRNYFEEFYTCPNCGQAIYKKNNLEKQYKEGTAFCTMCGQKIKEDIESALLSIKKPRKAEQDGKPMEISIKGEPKKIAALVSQLQERQKVLGDKNVLVIEPGATIHLQS